jgi:hypothetical protein
VTTTQALVDLGTQLVTAAQARGMTLRMFGGVAIYLHCPGIASNPRLQRTIGDLDFIVADADWSRIGEIISANGFTKQDESAIEQHFISDDVTVEISKAHFREDYPIDLTLRLTIIPLTLPLVDLLMLKLARIKFSEKDIQDCAALLVDHRVTSGGYEEDEINRDRLYQVANTDYRLWKTIFDNTVTLEKSFDQYLDPGEAQLAWRRTELLQEVLDGKSHSAGWWAGRLVTR